jgi:hypothetical protein
MFIPQVTTAVRHVLSELTDSHVQFALQITIEGFLEVQKQQLGRETAECTKERCLCV